MKNYLKPIAYFSVGVALSCATFYIIESLESPNTSKQTRQGNYKFINPLLECDVSDLISQERFVKFKGEVSELVKKEKNLGNITDISIYYRDLNNGPWFGINLNEMFLPASLLKLPLALSFYKAAEIDPSLLKKEVVYEGGEDLSDEQYFKPEVKLVKGKKYLLTELVEHSLVYSDNNAANLLYKTLGTELTTSVYKDIGLNSPGDPNYSLGVKNYSAFFRVLFNASYLSQSDSERILSILSSSKFDKGIKSGIPSEVLSTHKFGEALSGGIKQLHDCGIVYPESGPYLVCIMTRGTDFKNLERVIGDLSRVIYEKSK